MERIDTAGVQRLIERHAQVIEVLPPDAYECEHLPGARNIPLGSMQPSAVADLDVNCPTVTYCFDYQCDLSSRAARRLETLGFTEVYDYVASKAAWLACGLAAEGTIPDSARAGSIARGDVPRCALGEKVGDVRAELEATGVVVVVSDGDGVVLGVVHHEVTSLSDTTLVDEVLQPAPPTVRPSITADELARNMDDDGRTFVLVTALDGTLIGMIERADLHGHH